MKQNNGAIKYIYSRPEIIFCVHALCSYRCNYEFSNTCGKNIMYCNRCTILVH